MKNRLLLILLVVALASCKFYMEYTAGTKELNYSFPEAKAKRYSNLDKALETPEDVIFLDLHVDFLQYPNVEFRRLNENLHKFKNLKKLTLNCTEVDNANFPDNIYNCSNLEFLVIGGFRNLNPEKLKNLKRLNKLVFLSLEYCELKEIPKYVYELKSLEGLDLGLNKISSIPADIRQLSSLRTIDLTNNCLTEFPMNLSKCKNLQFIDVNNAEGDKEQALLSYGFCVNRMDQIEQLDSFPSLEVLRVSKVFEKKQIKELQAQYPDILIH